jgi:hypothetical protein
MDLLLINDPIPPAPALWPQAYLQGKAVYINDWRLPNVVKWLTQLVELNFSSLTIVYLLARCDRAFACESGCITEDFDSLERCCFARGDSLSVVISG